MFVEMMAYKSILEKWKENPDATKRQIGTWMHWSTDDEANKYPLTRAEAEMMTSYVEKYAPSTFRKIFQGSDEGKKT